jgi:predicted histidine transporter YuiF (NhaC family)
MMKASKGIRRLAVLLGSIGSMMWITFVMLVSKGFAEVQAPWGWVWLTVLAVICFLIPSLVVHGIAWLIRGFREDKRAD